jgi:hypothetical protein
MRCDRAAVVMGKRTQCSALQFRGQERQLRGLGEEKDIPAAEDNAASGSSLV